MLIVLDSLMSWGGVVDELDYAAKLSHLLSTNTKPLTSPILQGISCKVSQSCRIIMKSQYHLLKDFSSRFTKNYKLNF